VKKVELEIINVTQGFTQHHSYAVLLGEKNGKRRLPIVIGAAEAQAIVVAIENMPPTRPLTHDLMKNFMTAFDVELHEIVINDLQEGIFFSKLVCSSQNDTIEIDSRTSDALALAVRFGCPIYTYEDILEKAGSLLDDETKKGSMEAVGAGTQDESAGKENLKDLSLDELNKLLTDVLEHEDYIRAIAIRDEIKSREKK